MCSQKSLQKCKVSCSYRSKVFESKLPHVERNATETEVHSSAFRVSIAWSSQGRHYRLASWSISQHNFPERVFLKSVLLVQLHFRWLSLTPWALRAPARHTQRARTTAGTSPSKARLHQCSWPLQFLFSVLSMAAYDLCPFPWEIHCCWIPSCLSLGV